jgi:hypothetical protein
MLSRLSLKLLAKNRWHETLIEEMLVGKNGDSGTTGLLSTQILDTYFKEKDVWILGWTGYAKEVIDFVKEREGHGDYAMTRFTRVGERADQRRCAAFENIVDYRECKSLLKNLGGIVKSIDADDVKIIRKRKKVTVKKEKPFSIDSMIDQRLSVQMQLRQRKQINAAIETMTANQQVRILIGRKPTVPIPLSKPLEVYVPKPPAVKKPKPPNKKKLRMIELRTQYFENRKANEVKAETEAIQ